MLEIMTITAQTAEYFDKSVNATLKDGWELVRRECFITGSDRATTFYAELERVVEEPEEEGYSGDTAYWVLTRDPRKPYRCSVCGCSATKQLPVCPACDCMMVEVEE